jgi:hypothetical protein
MRYQLVLVSAGGDSRAFFSPQSYLYVRRVPDPRTNPTEEYLSKKRATEVSKK